MLFANAGRGKAGCAQGLWRGSHGFACSKAVYAVTVTILTVRVAVLAGQYAGAADGARGRRAKGVIKNDALSGKRVNAGCLNDAVSIARS